MSTADQLRKGLTSSPKYLPLSYRYDKQGSIYNDRFLSENGDCYYFSNSEINVIQTRVKDVVESIKTPFVLYDLGSGNTFKTRYFIDAILKKQKWLTCLPVDISEEFLYEQGTELRELYGDALTVKPIAGDYVVGINSIRYSEEPKLVIWLGGFQNEVYERQIKLLSLLKDAFSDKDRLLLTLDVTQNKEEIENAYLPDLTEVSSSLYLNAIWRLNKEFNSNINTDRFRLCIRYIENKALDTTSAVELVARSTVKQIYDIPGLNITVDFEENEPLHLNEGPGISCKYTVPQIKCMLKKSGLELKNIWMDEDNHVAACLIRK